MKSAILSAPSARGLFLRAYLALLRHEVRVCNGKIDRIDYEKAQLDIERAQVLADRAQLEDRIRELGGEV